MGSERNQQNGNDVTTLEQANVCIVMVPFPAHGHLNQMLQVSCLISSYSFPVHYVGSVIHNRQAKARVNGLNPQELAKIHFHNLPIPKFASPLPNPNSSNKFPDQLLPAWDATLSLRGPIATYLRDLSSKARRVVVIHDFLMAVVVQDVASIPNAESYAFNCISAACQARLNWEGMGKPFPKEIQDFPPIGDGLSDGIQYFVSIQTEPLNHRAGDIYYTCKLIEAPYLDLLSLKEVAGHRKNWAIGPIHPTKLSSAQKSDSQHKCLEWLDKQEPKSVIYVTFGTTTSLPDNQIEEIALGLEKSNQKFLWVLRDADKGDVFDGEVRRPKLPKGFEERVEGLGIVVRDWAPQPQILAHPSTGGFMSHCGWNSCMESISMGVPIAAWPMHSDQPINTILITEVLKTGILVREWVKREELVKASTVENVVKILMASEEGNEIRKRAEELAVTVQQATEEGGASRLELDSFVSHITR